MYSKKLQSSLIVILILFNSLVVMAQKPFFKVNAGYGIWESFHAGLDLRIKNISFGLDAGTSFNTLPFDNPFFSITLDNSYYWGKENKFGFRWAFHIAGCNKRTYQRGGIGVVIPGLSGIQDRVLL
jgi:hypothetical protein